MEQEGLRWVGRGKVKKVCSEEVPDIYSDVQLSVIFSCAGDLRIIGEIQVQLHSLKKAQTGQPQTEGYSFVL
jgi:hypothetical protein